MSGAQVEVKNLVTPVAGTDAANKDYVDGTFVAKTGDTMTGNLTVPAVNLSGSQSSAPNTVTRKDYVDAELAKKLDLTGGTLTGNLTAPAVLVSSAQNTSVNALTRKDYVDSVTALRVSKSGGTMTGELVIDIGSSSWPLRLVRNAHEVMIGNSITPGEYLFGGKATAATDYETYVRVGKTNLQYYNGVNYNIYHEGRKPTAAEIGAL